MASETLAVTTAAGVSISAHTPIRSSSVRFPRIEEGGYTLVTVARFRTCGALPRDVDYPKVTPAEYVQKSALCHATLANNGNLPANCMDWNAAVACCAKLGGRLPEKQELEAARAAGVPGPAGPDILFEWTATPKNETQKFTCKQNGDCEGGNQTTARNEDLGFRCVRGPLP